MASKSKTSFVSLGFLLCGFMALMLLLCLGIMQEHSGAVCVTGHGCYYEEMGKQNRKILSENEVGETSGGVNAAASSVELRMVPSGPDPLHHNGNTKKPRSP